ncbi:guanylate kinase [Liquorilactobacillus hordei DSM 19519]|uniref:Guanylate kinase n=1 Tax=Liquorilactobacillus hordei DSM 19519 TaxID=1423759 RepID=A0A0R1MWJ4_9LACO|nr:guanylate kinase [Liquorilactobacillus hordei DSM 19519]
METLTKIIKTDEERLNLIRNLVFDLPKTYDDFLSLDNLQQSRTFSVISAIEELTISKSNFVVKYVLTEDRRPHFLSIEKGNISTTWSKPDEEGTLYCLIGASGSGKTTLGYMTFGKKKEVISTTTRKPRKNEIDGQDYFFVNPRCFAEMYKKGKYAEIDSYNNNYYGIELSEIQDKTKNGDAYAVVTYEGYKQIKKLHPKTKSIFIYSSFRDTRKQMVERGDPYWQISKRLDLYEKDMENKNKCDYVVENHLGKLSDSLEQIQEIVKENK